MLAPLSPAAFRNPPSSFRPTGLYWLNDVIDPAVVAEQLAGFRDQDGYGSLAILPVTEYWEEGFLEKYGHLLESLSALGMWAMFCDDQSFPSGSAGGVIAKEHPEWCARQIYKSEWEVSGPATHNEELPAGTLLACVAMDRNDHARRIDLTAHASDGRLTWEVPAGDWTVLVFVCKRSTDALDYLNPAAVDGWIRLTYQRFYDRFPEHFGTTIKCSFYDDISLYQASPMMWNGDEHTCWTDGMHAAFRAKYGVDPTLLYPALWYDIGADTAAARVMFFGLRAALLSVSFVKRVAEWCTEHGIEASGHPAGDYEVSPMGFSGDAIKFYQHAQRPLVDCIFRYGHGRDGYKLASSAAFLYDRPLLQCETYGAFSMNEEESSFTPDLLYRTAMELFTRGINVIITHGVWYKYPAKICPPEISYRNPHLAAALPAYSAWIGRCHMLLQGGRHIADIAVLYPIAAIMADCHFGSEKTLSDYQEIGERLTRRIRRDFTFMHPEVLAEACTIDPLTRSIVLNNPVNHEHYRVLILPGRSLSRTMPVAVLRQAQRFFAHGGTVICTAMLPLRAAEPGCDAEVKRLVEEIFGRDPSANVPGFTKHTNAAHGAAYFIPDVDETVAGIDRLTAALDAAIAIADVRFEALPALAGPGEVSYIHKVISDKECYFFANSSDSQVSFWVRVRGRIVPSAWDPHSGDVRAVDHEHLAEAMGAVTRIRIAIDPNRSLFIHGASHADIA